MLDLNAVLARLGSIPIKMLDEWHLRPALIRLISEDVPQLVAEVYRLRAEVERLQRVKDD